MENLELYNKLRTPPKEALEPIEAGRLIGKTNITPMWRIQALTEQFGPCGIGWKYEITRQWTESGPGGEISAFCNILLYYRHDGQWSEGVPGTGGSAFVAKGKKGLYQSDECYKMALTDAISVAAKALGTGADIYWGNEPTKYGKRQENAPQQAREAPEAPACAKCGKQLRDAKKPDGQVVTVQQMAQYSQRKYGRTLCLKCQREERQNARPDC
ncbi:hypothetical protein D7X94_16195 [Acutalibacter sp. 1XD8-33]|uniref:hypothetical protein n=1 Tax=Acutalibacter sp. 1XD8-33 TaxID=2320081 RepID=UPI000EA0DF53|nr:hypothetical protein [Acutalibacter sp. 1XD8-33]RKJ38507.1 hypothetical protein D7X94_16195 [Acutalibacter sp. 1XD8-33]